MKDLKMRIITAFDMLLNCYQIKVEIGNYWYCFTTAKACEESLPYTGFKIEGEEIINFLDFMKMVNDLYLNDKVSCDSCKKEIT